MMVKTALSGSSTIYARPGDPLAILKEGTVIPAHPLALDANRRLDPVRQRALSRYYIDAGAGGLAVGVHTTQFAIRERGIYGQVLQLAMQTVRQWSSRQMVMVAGLAGPADQALAEAETALSLGYHAGLLSLAALGGRSNEELLEHCRLIAQEIPLIGFYLQPAVGGSRLDVDFWTGFAAIPDVVAIKIAAFDRYCTLDVMRGVVNAGAEDRITLYTGNDDHIILDLLSPFHVSRGSETITLRFAGGLLGHWSVWTSSAVRMFEQCKRAVTDDDLKFELLALDSQVTDCNGAFFDVANNFGGCIAGCHEILRRQGLLEGIWCLDPDETLGPGQMEEIDRVCAAYPQMNDDAFVRDNLERWLQ